MKNLRLLSLFFLIGFPFFACQDDDDGPLTLRDDLSGAYTLVAWSGTIAGSYQEVDDGTDQVYFRIQDGRVIGEIERDYDYLLVPDPLRDREGFLVTRTTEIQAWYYSRQDNYLWFNTLNPDDINYKYRRIH
jgi:hypothetical protein